MKAIDYKKLKIDLFAKTKDIRKYDKDTGNFYKSIVIMSKRADQIAAELKQEFQENSHISNQQDRSGEELSKMYEQLPKPTQLALYEFENDLIYYNDVNEK